jgi:hypothetical protein
VNRALLGRKAWDAKRLSTTRHQTFFFFRVNLYGSLKGGVANRIRLS